MESQRETMRAQQEKIRAVRKAMMAAAFAENYNEEVVRAKALEVAKLEAELTVQRLKAVAEVQPALSKEQLEKILNPSAQMAPMGDGQGPNSRLNRPPGGPPPRRDPQ
jgi:Spy/CpxP family protein refolding chaperone